MSEVDQEELSETEIPGHAEEGVAKSSNPAAAEVLRIEHNLSVTWGGVSGCCSGDQPQREVTAAFQQWIGQQISAHSGKRYLRSGHGGGTANCTSSRAPWPDNTRKCRGSAEVLAYIEFMKT